MGSMCEFALCTMTKEFMCAITKYIKTEGKRKWSVGLYLFYIGLMDWG